MSIVRKIAAFLSESAIQIAAGAIIFLVFGAAALISVPILAISWLLIFICKSRINLKRVKEHELKDAISALRIIERDINLGASLISSLHKAFNAVPGRELRSFLNSLYARSVRGERPDNAMISSVSGLKSNEVKDAMLGIANAYSSSGSVQAAIRSGISKLEGFRDDKLSSEAASMSRNSMAVMVLGTILPSMAIFTFVGYSMLYYSASMLIMFSTALLVVVPAVYSTLKLKMVGFYAY